MQLWGVPKCMSSRICSTLETFGNGRVLTRKGWRSDLRRLGTGCGGVKRCMGRGRCVWRCESMAESNGESADWEKEMDAYKKRILKPNQLATLRQMEAENSCDGKVLCCEEDIAMVEGLSIDAPVGTIVSFEEGSTGILLWHGNDDECAVLVPHGQSVREGESVTCTVRGVIQLVDESAGPLTKREYEVLNVQTGPRTVGKVVDYTGEELYASTPGDPSSSSNAGAVKPLLNEQVTMENREVISEPLVTGVKAVDALTPIGRGQNMLILGGKGSGKTSLALDIILAQKESGVQCVYAAVDCDMDQSGMGFEDFKSELDAQGALSYTTIVGRRSSKGCVGECYAVMCAACSIAEQIRDSGGHALVVIDSLKPIIDLWILMSQALQNVNRVGGEDVDLIADEKKATTAEFDLVEYEGMLVTNTAAQRRRFFGSFLQRAAKVKESLGGGTLTLFGIMPGVPATGIMDPTSTIPGYETLSDEMKAKLLAVLEKKRTEMRSGEKGGDKEEGVVELEVVEEFMSIADGQVVLEDGKFQVASSISRIGSRASAKLMGDVAPLIRLDLAQAEDARQFASDPEDPVAIKVERRAQILMKALEQQPGRPVAVEDQVVALVAITSNLMDHMQPEIVPTVLAKLVDLLHQSHEHLFDELKAAAALTDDLRARIVEAASLYLENMR